MIVVERAKRCSRVSRVTLISLKTGHREDRVRDAPPSRAQTISVAGPFPLVGRYWLGCPEDTQHRRSARAAMTALRVSACGSGVSVAPTLSLPAKSGE